MFFFATLVWALASRELDCYGIPHTHRTVATVMTVSSALAQVPDIRRVMFK